MKSGDEKTSVWTLPNRLSLVRILFIPAIIYLISRQERLALLVACLLFVVAGITDGLDGLIARRMSMKTRFGLYLDPIADKLLVSCVLITLSCYRTSEFGVPLWATLIMVSREFLINGLRSFYAVGGSTLHSSFAGKLKTTLQIVGISCVLFSGSTYGSGSFQTAGLVLIYAALVFSLYSAFRYVYGVFRADAKG